MTVQTEAFKAGIDAWNRIMAADEYLEFPANPYGDEWQNKPAQDFRAGFDAAAEMEGYSYSSVSGEYVLGGKDETDEFPERGDE